MEIESGGWPSLVSHGIKQQHEESCGRFTARVLEANSHHPRCTAIIVTFPALLAPKLL